MLKMSSFLRIVQEWLEYSGQRMNHSSGNARRLSGDSIRGRDGQTETESSGSCRTAAAIRLLCSENDLSERCGFGKSRTIASISCCIRGIFLI